MSKPKRIDAASAHDLLESGEARLVCAYDDEEKCRERKLPWAISLHELELEVPSLSKDQRIVFY